MNVPVCPFYIDIPENINPGMGFSALPGHIDIYELAPIDTKNWTHDDIEKNKENTRKIFVEFHENIQKKHEKRFIP